MRKTQTILSVISLFVTSLVLIFLVFGWYVVNSKATVSGVKGSIMEKVDIVDSCKVYSFSDVTTSNGTSTYTLARKDEFRYDPDFDKSPTAKLIEINFIGQTVNINKLSINTSGDYFPGYSSTSTTGYISSVEDISLTSVIKYTIVNNVNFSSGHTDTEGTVSFTTPSSYSSFSYDDNNGRISSRSQDLISSSTQLSTSLYILLDFNSESFDKLLSNNIGNSVMDNNTTNELKYLTDFKFELAGSVVNS